MLQISAGLPASLSGGLHGYTELIQATTLIMS